ncbi:LacI family DNA-binding transcriptional regulator [Pseudoroseomonas wenyumeiae]|uniref:LacI family DNA-binding transcriptional regulator n=1 Tax=Teichococcus wenyumeiae TaxID=2478470 RepID=A0A3A9JRB4_9PROT|nr:LacI family DNA-binding transcriptional regulator [Pseudoroseomonas wenyumeiae]RKK03208.1 LacI family transcriptional regulator [Pseudoroseomonas wenyumeiae]RMI15570.1 LacI family DNA-binding transcriptional regulator [Pseudoroseomonas wenyumeiae]
MVKAAAHRPRATIVDISAQAGVSTATVSRALNGDTRISAATRRRVHDAAQALGYTVDVLARSLQSGRSGLVGLVLGSTDNPFYGELLQEVMRQSAERGTRILILHAGFGPMERPMLEAILQYRLDGCIVSSAEPASQVAAICEEHGVPAVMVNRLPMLRAAAVACDNTAGGRELADFLCRGGHRSFGIAMGPVAASTAQEREHGFVSRLAEHGFIVSHRFIRGENGVPVTSYGGGWQAGLDIADLPARERPEAVLAISDIMAIGLIEALRERGLHVPQDISVVGFDGIRDGARASYSLTTVRQPLPQMVAWSLDMLDRHSGSSAQPETLLIPGELVIRNSARLPPD